MNYGSAKQTLLNNGYSPIPVMGKKPALDNWRENIAPEGYGGYNVGILCGKIAAVDIDITDKEIAEQLKDYALQICGETTYRIGKAPKVLLVYRSSGNRKKVSKRYDCGRIEVLGEGQQFVAFGTHPDTKRPYIWPGLMGSILDTPAASLPLISEEQMRDIISRFESIMAEKGLKPLTKESTLTGDNLDYDPDDPLDRVAPIGVPLDRCKAILKDLDPDCSRDEWRNVGMALHFEFSGSPEALALWDEWSSKGAKYKAGEPEKQWGSFGHYSGRPLTGAYLLKQEKKVDIDIWSSESKVFIPTWDNQPANEVPLLTLNRVPILSRGNISMITAFAGSGKSSIVEAACASLLKPDSDTLGLKFETTLRVVMIDTERSHSDTHRAWRRLMRRSGIEHGEPVPESIEWYNIRGVQTIKERLKHLEEIISTAPDVIIIDGIGDYLLDPNDSEECVKLVNALCAFVHNNSAGILLTLHTNPGVNTTKARGVIGSELWRKCQFVGIIQKLDDGVRCLTSEYDLGKNRSGSDTLTVSFKWDDNLKMHVTVPTPEAKKKVDKDKACERVFEYLQTAPGTIHKKGKIVDAFKGVLSRYVVSEALDMLVSEGKIDLEDNGCNFKAYRVIDKMHGVTIEGEEI